jgi:hypothetical protein
MQVQLLVERDQNECVVKLAGMAYKFKRNASGHLVSEITDGEHIKRISDPFHSTVFKEYSVLKKITEEVVDDAVVTEVTDAVTTVTELPVHEQVGKDVFAPHTGQGDKSPEAKKSLPPYPQKGSKRPKKRKR